MSTEDIGLADPRALELAISAWNACERLGQPEGELALAEAVVYLAVAPKSNALDRGYRNARQAVLDTGSLEVPLAIRNAPTGLMKDLGYAAGYRYDHDEPGAHASGQRYLPDRLGAARFYEPSPRGLELKIAERLRHLRGEPAAS
jgi:putative ATPase